MPEPETQLTLVAYLGEKPAALAGALTDCQERITAALRDDFEPYVLDQIHATIVGLERIAGNGRDNLNLRRLRGRRDAMDIAGFLASLRDDASLPLVARFGGFVRGGWPFASRGRTPWERTFSIQGDKAVLMGWPVLPGDPDQFPQTVSGLRRRAEAFNIVHAYHPTTEEADNDLYLRLGTLRKSTEATAKHALLETTLRDALAAAPVTVPLTLGDLRVAAYRDPTLPPETTRVLAPPEWTTPGALDDLSSCP